MISHTTETFRSLFIRLPKGVQRQAKEAYAKFSSDPYYPGLHFKRVHSSRPIYSVRVSRNYRALGILKANEMIWFWIGSHSEYDKVID